MKPCTMSKYRIDKPNLRNVASPASRTTTHHCSLLKQQQYHHPREIPIQPSPIPTMDAVLRQSKAMCPFLKKASPATLRALSTSTRPGRPQASSPCGGTMSKLQLLAHRCPVMGKALAVQSAKFGHVGGGIAGLSTHSVTGHHGGKLGKARSLHSSRSQEARAVDGPLFTRDKSMLTLTRDFQQEG